MIYLIWAPPSEGKSYYVTNRAVELLIKGRKRIFSNYPIVYQEPLTPFQFAKNVYNRITKKPLIQNKVYSTYKWETEYVYKGITNSVIILDEAYMYYSSRKKDVDKDVHSFFATNGHDGNDFYLIAQHYNRLDLIIREMASYYVFVSKISNPLSLIGSGAREGELMPLLFKIEFYLSEEEFKYRRIHKTVFKQQRIFFNKRIAHAYDTRFFRKTEKSMTPVKWVDLMTPEMSVIDVSEKEEIEKWTNPLEQ